MRLLLDTHAFLWWLAGDDGLSAAARAAIGDEGNDVFVSAASA
jgi:PIN domain nuclease of toxin-antitoxin system